MRTKMMALTSAAILAMSPVAITGAFAGDTDTPNPSVDSKVQGESQKTGIDANQDTKLDTGLEEGEGEEAAGGGATAKGLTDPDTNVQGENQKTGLDPNPDVDSDNPDYEDSQVGEKPEVSGESQKTGAPTDEEEDM